MAIEGRSDAAAGRKIRLGMVGGGEGVKGMAFIEAAVESSKANGKWVKPARA
jgi:hypothetical protein